MGIRSISVAAAAAAGLAALPASAVPVEAFDTTIAPLETCADCPTAGANVLARAFAQGLPPEERMMAALGLRMQRLEPEAALAEPEFFVFQEIPETSLTEAPLPAAWGLFAFGSLALAGLARRRRQ